MFSPQSKRILIGGHPLLSANSQGLEGFLIEVRNRSSILKGQDWQNLPCLLFLYNDMSVGFFDAWDRMNFSHDEIRQRTII